MTFSELCKFGFWRIVTVLFGWDFYERPVLSKVLIVVGKPLVLVGVIVFATAPQWGTSSYDYTVKLDEPQPILSDSRLLAANDRVYVFVEEMCAVNVYEENGTFLFCVRGPRNQNGKAHMFLSGTDIYIITRRYELLRFDGDGDYCGKAENPYPAGTEDRVYAEKDYAETDEAFYWARLNTIQRTSHGGTQVFAKTPLYLYYIKSAGLGWLTLVFGLLLEYLADKLFKRKQSKKQSAA